MIRFANVSKRYGTLTVLDGLDLDISAGEMVSVIGPSGSGKTTVLRVLMTLESIDGGVIYVDGQPLTEGPVYSLGMARQDARERAEELLDLVGVADKKDQYPSRLSGGQQQRVAIARALAMRPKVMLFDEVTSALDPEVIGEVTNVIRKLVDELNLTMLMVTHQMGFARDISDRVCFFYAGKIEEQGSPEEVFDNPRKERTQQFLSAVKEAR